MNSEKQLITTEPALNNLTKKYKHISNEKKKDLIFRTMFLNENLRSVCQELGFNISTGRNLIQRYKNTGRYITNDKEVHSKHDSEEIKFTFTKESLLKSGRCSLGLGLFGDEIKIICNKSYTPEEEAALLRLHMKFMNSGMI